MIFIYKYILFDLDGTITDSGPGITNAAQYALRQQNIIVNDPKELLPFVGPPLQDSFSRYFGLEGEANAKAIRDFRVYYAAGGKYESVVYDGIENVIAALHDAGKTLILCTSKLETAAVDIIRHFGLDRYFDFIAGGVDGVRCEKDSVIEYAMQWAAEKNGAPADKSEFLMIGDRKYDIIGAKKTGIDSMGVLFGFGSREELAGAGAEYIAAVPEDILSFIK